MRRILNVLGVGILVLLFQNCGPAKVSSGPTNTIELGSTGMSGLGNPTPTPPTSGTPSPTPFGTVTPVPTSTPVSTPVSTPGSTPIATPTPTATPLACGELNSTWTPNWSSLQTYLKLNETSLGTAPGNYDFFDSSGKGHHGYQNNAVILNQTGKYGGAVGFNSNSDVAIPISGINTNPLEYVTVAFWMYWKGGLSSSADSWSVPFSFSSNLSLTFNGSGSFGFCTYNNDLYGTSSSKIPTNTWVHVVAVIRNTSITENQIYINGVQQSMSQILGAPASSAATADVVAYAGGLGNSGSSFTFRGMIDDLAIFNGALSASQVSTIYNRQKDARPVCP